MRSLIKSMLNRLGLLALLMLTAACMGPVKAPQVNVAGVRVGGIGLQGGLMYVRLNVTNPNRFGLKLAGVEYDLDVGGAGGKEWLGLAEGISQEPISLGSGATAQVDIPVAFTYQELGPALQMLLNRGALDYRLIGAVSLAQPTGIRIPFSHQGVADLTSGAGLIQGIPGLQ